MTPPPHRKRPRVSVVMAVHNGEAFVRDAMRSIFRQSLDDFEFIVIDDGSTDQTGAVVESVADSRVRLLVNETNLGLTASLNRGLSAAQGEFVARIDADDIAHRHRLARQVSFLSAQSDVALVGSSFRTFGPGRLRSPAFWLPTGHHQLRFALMFYCPFIHSAAMWRREPVEQEIGRYNPAFSYAMDWEFWSRIANRFQVANLPQPLVRYRVGDHSMTATYVRQTEEAAAARRASLQLVMGNEEAAIWNQRASELYAIITGFERGTPVTMALAAVRELQAQYEAKAGMSGEDLSAFRRDADGWIVRRLVREADLAKRRSERALAKSLSDAAFHADPRVAITASVGRFILALINGRRA